MPDPIILVVEADEVQRRFLRARITRWGYRVIEARTRAEALSALAKEPALILLDVDLPNLDGLQLARVVKANPFTSAIPIVAVTAMVGDEKRILAAGCDGCVSNPIDSRRLLAFLRRFIPVPR